MRILTLSTLFPDASRPTFGIFVERQTLGLAAREGVEVRVISPRALPPAPLDSHPRYKGRSELAEVEDWKGLRVYRPRFTHFPGPAVRYAPAFMVHRLRRYLMRIREEFPFDILDAEYFWPDGPAAAFLGEALNVPVSIKARGSDIHLWGQRRFGRRHIVKAADAAHGLLAVSDALKRDMVALGLPEEKIRVHYTGVDLDRFVIADRAAAKAALNVTGPLIVCVGYLIERKGQKLVIEAMKHLPDATLLLVGDGPARQAIEAQIGAAELSDRVRLLGPQPHEALPALFAAADVSALPSSSEGLANVWVESIACGTPVVIADVGGARELVDSPAAGRIVARDAHAIAQAIRSVIESPFSREETRRAAERFTWERNSEALHAHLSGLIERHQRGGNPSIFPA